MGTGRSRAKVDSDGSRGDAVATSVWHHLVDQLRDRGITFDAGLTDAEVEVAEARFGIRFPPDLRAFLQTGLPCGQSFPDWRAGDPAMLRAWLDLPRRGIWF